jgi:hypothetical protein
MSNDIRFDTDEALDSFPLTVVEGRYEDGEDGEEYVSGYTQQNVAGWLGVVCPTGYTLVRGKDEVAAALVAAGVEFEYC